jgi:phosphoglycerate dehydrogenase-like enzyme
MCERGVKMFRLLVLQPETEQARAWAPRIANDVSEATVVVPRDEKDAVTALEEGAEAAYGALPAHLLARAINLQWLQAPWAGAPPGFYYPELIEHPVVVTSMRGTYTEYVAAHAVSLVLALARRLGHYVRRQVEHEWVRDDDPSSVVDLPDATVLLVGLGGVGTQVAQMLAPFGCTMLATDAGRAPLPNVVDEMHPPEDLDRLLKRADIVIVTVPHTPRTHGLFNAERIAMMKAGAVLVNVGRGPVVDVDAVASALMSGTLRGAGLDVFAAEPLAASHPLWDLPDALITPHVAGVGPHWKERSYGVFLDNARRFARGEPLVNVVDKAEWY